MARVQPPARPTGCAGEDPAGSSSYDAASIREVASRSDGRSKVPPLPPLPRGCAQARRTRLRMKPGHEALEPMRGGYDDFL